MKAKGGFYKFNIQLFAGTAFVVNDKLPATTQLKIAWTTELESWNCGFDWNNDLDTEGSTKYVRTTDGFFLVGAVYDDSMGVNFIGYKRSTNNYLFYSSIYADLCGDSNNASCSTYKYFIIDTSGWTESQRTITTVDAQATTVGLIYEDLNATSSETITVGSSTTEPAVYEEIDTFSGSWGQAKLYLIEVEVNSAQFVIYLSGHEGIADGDFILTQGGPLNPVATLSHQTGGYYIVDVTGLTANTTFTLRHDFRFFAIESPQSGYVQIEFTTTADVSGTNNLSIGSTAVSKLTFGNINISKIYVGSTLVYEIETNPLTSMLSFNNTSDPGFTWYLNDVEITEPIEIQLNTIYILRTSPSAVAGQVAYLFPEITESDVNSYATVTYPPGFPDYCSWDTSGYFCKIEFTSIPSGNLSLELGSFSSGEYDLPACQ